MNKPLKWNTRSEKFSDKFDVDNNPELHIAILARISQKWIQQLDE